MNLIVVNIADARVSTDAADELVTYSLGSCVGVAVYDPVARVGGLLHGMLPLSSADPRKAARNPFMFVDTGMTRLLTELFAMGLTRARAVVKIAGCARILDNADYFRIGERNYAVVRKILWKNGILIASESIGGLAPRTLRLEMATGRCMLRSHGTEIEL